MHRYRATATFTHAKQQNKPGLRSARSSSFTARRFMTHLCRGLPCRNTSRTEKPRMNSHSCTSTQPHYYTTTQVHTMSKPKPNFLDEELIFRGETLPLLDAP